MTTDPARAVEVERTYDADDGTPLPDWSGVAEVGPVEVRMLDARYFDTADLALARADTALRRRTGGRDAGWHIKGPRRGDARLELSWPLGAFRLAPPSAVLAQEPDEGIPAAVVEALAEWASPPFTPLARIRNTRHAYALLGPAGVLAEFADDHVEASDLRSGAQRAWREWEVELGPAAPADEAAREAFFAVVERAIFAAGAQPSASASKLARALGG